MSVQRLFRPAAPRATRLVSLPVAALAALVASCSSGGDNGSGGSGSDLAPRSSTSISGNQSYGTVNIPAGVTVTITSDMVMTVTGNVTVAGAVVAPCHALSLSAGGTVTVTGSIDNECSDTTVDGSQLEIIGKGGYDFEGATVTTSGDLWILDGPEHPGASVAGPARHAQASPPTGTYQASSSDSYRCKMVNSTFHSIPFHARNGKPGSPKGDDGTDGHSKTTGCGQLITGQTGGNLLISGLTIDAQDGGAGGTGTSEDAQTATGGKGGRAGAIAIVSDGDIVIGGESTINGGDGGAGGDGVATPPSEDASALGGIGGALQPKNYSSPITLQAGGSITLNAALHLKLGHGGNGGQARATGANGAPGRAGLNATATGGNGGASAPSKVIATGSVVQNVDYDVSGGAGGNGGDAVANTGNGGNGATPGQGGGSGGDGTAVGGNGGDGIDRTGGNAGKVTLNGGNGGKGADNCTPPPGATGGIGGPGGTASGHDGLVGPGATSGAAGSITILDSFNGDTAGKGNPSGAAGLKGTNSMTSSSAGTVSTIVNSFLPGYQPPNCDGTNGAPLQMSVSPSIATVTDGDQGEEHVSFTRGAPVTGSISVMIEGPTGETLATTTVPATSSSADVEFEVPLDLPIGNDTLTVTASASGTPDVVAKFVAAVGAVSGTPITFHVCDPNLHMDWAASMIPSRPPVERHITNNSFSLAMSGTGGEVEFVKHNMTTGEIITHIYDDTPGNLAAIGTQLCLDTPPLYAVPGILRNTATTDQTFVSAAWATVDVAGPAVSMTDKTFSLPGVKGGVYDIVAAWRSSVNGPATTGLLLGNVTIPPSGSVTINKTASNIFTISNSVMIPGNVLGWPTMVTSSLRTANGTRGVLAQTATATGPTFPIYGIQGSALPPTAIQEFEAAATSGGSMRRIIIDSHILPSLVTGNLPSAITFTPMCVSIAGHPVRIAVMGVTTPGLDQLWSMKLQQTITVKHTINWQIGASYVHAGGTYNFQMNDYSGVNFDDAAWGLAPDAPFDATNTVKGSNMAGGATSWVAVDGRIVDISSAAVTTQCP